MMTKLEDFIEYLKTSGLHPRFFLEQTDDPYPEFPEVVVRLSGINSIDHYVTDKYIVAYAISVEYHERKINRIFQDAVNVRNILERWGTANVEEPCRMWFSVRTINDRYGTIHFISTAEIVRLD